MNDGPPCDGVAIKNPPEWSENRPNQASQREFSLSKTRNNMGKTTGLNPKTTGPLPDYLCNKRLKIQQNTVTCSVKTIDTGELKGVRGYFAGPFASAAAAALPALPGP